MTAVLPITFEDKHEYGGTQPYLAVNECLETWNELLDGVEVDNFGGIASAGEVGFFALLPHTRKRLVLIDHTYESLNCAVAKANLVKKHGAKEARDKLLAACASSGSYWNTVSVYGKEREQQAAIEKLLSKYSGGNLTRYSGLNGYHDIRTVWETRIKDTDLEQLEQGIDKIEFVHGDINDLADFGQFDALYLSNALEYTGRDHRHDAWDVTKLVKPGGYVLWCVSTYSYPNRRGANQYKRYIPPGEIVKVQSGRRTGSMDWTYELVKTPE